MIPQPFEPTSEVSPREKLLVGAVVLLGFLLRVLPSGGLAIEHFDEGVYASNLCFDAENEHRYPDRHLYAPPLFPFLVENSIAFFGPLGYGPMVVSLLAGSCTTILVWWTGRRWFGSAGGLIASVLVALCDVHMIYSRAALTDVLMSCLLIASLLLLCRGLARRELLPALAGGVVCGLCWLTKYNGWLPLVIALTGLLAWWLAASGGERQEASLRYRLVLLAAAALVATVVWSPAYFDLDGRGGYAAVAENHRQYVVGISGWFDSLTRQIATLRQMQSWPTLIGVGVAPLLPVALTGRSQPPGGLLLSATLGIVSVACAMLFGAAVTLGVLATIGLIAVLKTDREPHEASLGRWMTAAWFVGLLVATPLYRAYPRLTLPWMLASIIAAGGGFAWLQVRLQTMAAKRRALLIAAMSAPFVVIVATGFWWPLPSVPAWEPRTGIQQLAGTLDQQMRVEARHDLRASRGNVLYVSYVYGEPALFYQLRTMGVVTGPVQHLEMSHDDIPTFLITGPHAHRSEEFSRQQSVHRDRLELLSTFPYQPSMLVRSNDPESEEGPQEVRLYRIDGR